MKFLIGILLLVILYVLLRIGIQHLSAKSTAPGIIENASGNSDQNSDPGSQSLAPCPDTPNCFQVEVITEDGESGLNALEKALSNTVGITIAKRQDNYLHATSKSSIMGYIDDLEVLRKEDRLQIRSASRLGHSDLGANKKRVDQLLTDAGLGTSGQ